MSTRALVESALRDCLGYSRLRPLARRARLQRLYFQLRGTGMRRKHARLVVARARKAMPGLRKAPESIGMALDLVVA